MPINATYSLVMKLINSETHSCTVSLASLAILALEGSCLFMILEMFAIGRKRSCSLGLTPSSCATASDMDTRLFAVGARRDAREAVAIADLARASAGWGRYLLVNTSRLLCIELSVLCCVVWGRVEISKTLSSCSSSSNLLTKKVCTQAYHKDDL